MTETILLCGAAALAVFALVRTVYWYLEGRKLQVSGYMTPPSTKLARWTFKAVANVGTRLLVGPVDVKGKENAQFKGRGLVLPNHMITWDFGVVGKAIPFSYRQLSKAAEIKNPVIATLAAWIGTVGVQVEGGKSQDGGGQAVVDTGARILAHSKGSRMLLFPQGMLVYSGDTSSKTFRTGASRMLTQAASSIGDDPLYALPVAIRYKTDKREATWLQRLLYPLGLKFVRTFRYSEKELGADGQPVIKENGKPSYVKKSMVLYGAYVSIGKPIAYKDLPSDPRAAIECVRQSIETMLAEIDSRRPKAI
jgi:1-acyl-sn-glycerol-3-phosphate acyltransferase